MLPWQTGSEPFSVMTQQQLYEWITHPELLNRDTLYELRTLLARYPYFQTVRLLYLKNLFLLHDITFGEELRKAALYVADRKVLFYLIEGERFIISPLDKQEKPKEEGGLDRTLSLIDAFLSSLPEDSAAVELPMDVTADYTSFLLHEEEHPSDDGIPRMKGQSLIDDFIEKSAEEPLLPQLGIKEEVPVKKEMPEEDEPEAEEDIEDESYFTETLAKIYVKQQRYSKALEIIKKLNLKYPVYENIELPLLYMGISASERKKRVEAAMERMAITHRSKHFPQQLSGGQQQRVAIARAVVANPKLILADEPTGNLDSKNGKEVMGLLSELNNEGTTIVMVTHSQHDAGYADRIINLFDGQVVTEVSM